MALAHFGDKLAVGAVGVGDKPVIHLAHTKHLIHKSLWIAFAQFDLFCKEFGAAYFDSVGITHSTKLMRSQLVGKDVEFD